MPISKLISSNLQASHSDSKQEYCEDYDETKFQDEEFDSEDCLSQELSDLQFCQ